MRAYNFITISIVVLLIALMPVRSEADDWPNWRGPQHNGISQETNWLGDWPAFEPVILWEQQVGTGFSSIAVADGRVYTMGNSTRMMEDLDAGGRSGVGHKPAEVDEVFCLDPGFIWIIPMNPRALVANVCHLK